MTILTPLKEVISDLRGIQLKGGLRILSSAGRDVADEKPMQPAIDGGT